MAAAFATIDNVVDGLAEQERTFRARQDRRAIFLTLYGVVSAEVQSHIHRGAFADPEWTHRYAVAFANLYREALENYDAGRIAAVPKAWRLCFDAARGGGGLVLQDMLLGVNAHVNNDLPLALTRAAIDPERDRRRRDHDAVNAILGSVTERATARLAQLYAPGFTAMDECAGGLDEMMSLFSLELARESAWESAVSLANARNDLERALAGRLIASRAAVIARLLLSPTRSPTFAATCRQLEAGPGWLRLAADVRRTLERH